MREEGWYFVQPKNEPKSRWIVAEYVEPGYWRDNFGYIRKDTFFRKIDERPIVREKNE